MSTRRASAKRASYAEPDSSENETPVKASTPKKKAKTSPRKSQYFAADENDSESSFHEGSSSDAASIASNVSEEESGVSESSEQPTKAKRRTVAKGAAKRATPVKRKAVVSTTKKDDSDDGPDGEVFIPNVEALPEGDTPYTERTIHPNTLTFLQMLAENNDRAWFAQHIALFRAAETDFKQFVEQFNQSVQRLDTTIPEYPVKDLVYRIYRDVRFSNDQTPYKRFLSAGFTRAGRKGGDGGYAGYHLMIKPGGKTLLGCGLWHPPPAMLANMRHMIDTRVEDFRAILEADAFKQLFKGEEGLLESGKEDALKTSPRDYPKTHPEIELLKLRSFCVEVQFSDEETTSPDFIEILETVLTEMVPFVHFLNRTALEEDD